VRQLPREPFLKVAEETETVGGAPPNERTLWSSREVRSSAAAGLLVALGLVADQVGATSGVSTAAYLVATGVGARFFAAEAAEMVVRNRVVGIELLMTVAAVTAAALGLWGEAASLAFLYSISEALEEFAEDRARDSIRALMDLAPKRTTRLTAPGAEEIIDVERLRVGDRFLVRPGEAIATDGVVDGGATAVDESAVTGESMPVEKAVGDQVFAGTLNTTGALVVMATATAGDNTLSKIVHLVMEAQEQKGRSERFMRRFSLRYSPAVLISGVLVALVGGVVTGEWTAWSARAASVIVAAAPCALVISIPITYVAAMGLAGRHGVLIKGGVHLEELATTRVVVLDKTGTLTRGKPQVVSAETVDGIGAREFLAIAASIERLSEHPLAKAIVGYAADSGIDLRPVSEFESLVGAGVEALIGETKYLVGSPRLMQGRGRSLDAVSTSIEALQHDGHTAVVVADGGHALGVLGIADVLRPNATQVLQQLRRLGVERLVMLTGDNPRSAASIARQGGIDEYTADLRPEDKSTTVAALKAAHQHVAMVGDGVNDAPALAAASVGIAMGAAGSDIALETADVVLMADDLTKLVDAIEIGRRTRRVVRQNLVLSVMVLAALIPGALVGWLTLPVAVLAHELSEFAVIGNGMRIAR